MLARTAQRPGIRRLDPAQCDPIAKTYPEFTNLTLRCPNGDLLCSYLPHAVQHMKPEALHAFGFSPCALTQSTSNVFTGPTSGRKLVGTTQKVLAESGGEPGFLLLGNDLLKLNERIFFGLPQDATIGIFDRTETLVFRSSEPDKWIGQPIPPANHGQYNELPEGQAVITAIGGVRRMYAWTTIPGLGWRVYAGVPEAQALGPYWQARNTVAGAVALLLMASLAEVTHYMVDGDLAARAAVFGPRELRTLATQFNAMLDVQAAAVSDLRDSGTRWQFAIDGAGDALWDWDFAAGTVFFSARRKTMLGHTEAEVCNGLTEWSSRVHPDDMAAVMADLQPHLDGTTPQYVKEHRVRCKDGSYKWILDRGLVVARDADGKPLRMVGTHSDITQRKLAEQALQASLRDKEALLKKVHHRVKNKLQVITSLLRLESRRNAVAEAVDVLKAMQCRIHAMGALKVGMDQAISCGFLTNELVSNALKHGFPDGRAGAIYVELQPADPAAAQTDALWRSCVRDTGEDSLAKF